MWKHEHNRVKRTIATYSYSQIKHIVFIIKFNVILIESPTLHLETGPVSETLCVF
jgi:hypothetical protein